MCAYEEDKTPLKENWQMYQNLDQHSFQEDIDQ